MSIRSRKQALIQLDKTLSHFERLRLVRRPGDGWLKAIRKVLGMSARQLGERAGIAQATVAEIEDREQAGTVTIATLEKMARVMDCSFVYALVPNSSLESTLRNRAEALARARVLGTAHSMRLEKQAVDDESTKAQIALIADEIMADLPRYMWDKDGA